MPMKRKMKCNLASLGLKQNKYCIHVNLEENLVHLKHYITSLHKKQLSKFQFNLETVDGKPSHGMSHYQFHFTILLFEKS